jgi:predicted AAA+ superfamily ATPase
MKPWKEIAIPRKDVLEGTLMQSEFAADISAVHNGKATPDYQDAAAFYERTFITEGMRLLLTQVAQRLSGQGGEPVIQLQTSFGGGKTHTMLAVYHLATRKCPLADLQGIPALIDQAKLMDPPRATVAVLDGTNIGPAQPRNHDGVATHTLWGELAWQLGKAEGYALVREADLSGTSPGKDVLRSLLEMAAPCVVLVDELVAYIRQFGPGERLTGGTYDTNLSFVQALTEAVKLVPNAILLASLPESETEAGQRGVEALRALEKTFGRVQALWKPVATEEAFEIVRRRLFEPVRDVKGRDAVCRAFADTYVAEGTNVPGETHEARYYERLVHAYPIHPEVFDRLYEDWSTLDSFQRTRGVLKLMAKVIFRLWKDDNKDLMIMPGGLPLYDGSCRGEFTSHLSGGWDPVVEKDIDGERAETTELESKEPRFGQINAARRVARTVFLGSAPASVATKSGIRGLDRARILLGSLQPGQASSVYSDALNRLADLLHYLNASGDKAQDATRFWFDTRANLRREMNDRRGRFDEAQVRGKIAEALKSVFGSSSMFDGVHVFTPHGDVPDDSALRLVVLPTDKWFSKEESRPTEETVLEITRSHGNSLRHRSNRLMFLAVDHNVSARLRDAARTVLAWNSIVVDIENRTLTVDLNQQAQAKQELMTAEGVLPRTAREAYCWLLVPHQEVATDPKPTIEHFKIPTSGSSAGAEIERLCLDNELVIENWGAFHLANLLKEFYWKTGEPTAKAMAVWDDTQKYLYMPRLKDKGVISRTIQHGAASEDFFGIAYGRNGEEYTGFTLGRGHVQFDDTLLLIEPATASAYRAARVAPTVTPTPDPGVSGSVSGPGVGERSSSPYAPPPPVTPSPQPTATPRAKSFYGTADVPAATAKMRLMQLADEIIANLVADPNAHVTVTLEISAVFDSGAQDGTRRTVAENAAALKLRAADWE